MRQSLQEYIEARLELGGCVMWVGGIIITVGLTYYMIVSWIGWIKENLFFKLALLLVVICVIICIIYVLISAKKPKPKKQDIQDAKVKENIYSEKLRNLGAEHDETMAALNNLAVAYNKLGNYKKAIELEEQVYNSRCRVSGETHRETIRCLVNLAVMYKNSGDCQKAIEMNNKCLDLQIRTLGIEHADVRDTINRLNNCALVLDSYADSTSNSRVEDYYRHLALSTFEKAYEMHCKAGREHSEDALCILFNIGHTYFELVEYRKAYDVLKKAHDLQVKFLGHDHYITKQTSKTLGDASEKVLMWKL